MALATVIVALMLGQVSRVGPTMMTARAHAPASLDPAGFFTVCGGGSTVATCERLDLRTGLWSVSHQLPFATRAGGMGRTLVGRQLVLSDYAAPPCRVLDFDGGVTSVSTDHIGVDGTPGMVGDDGAVLFFGGNGGSMLQSGLQRLPQGQASWTNIPNVLSQARRQHTVTFLGADRFAAIGGIATAASDRIDIVSDTGALRGVGNLATARSNHASTLLFDRRVLVAAGTGAPSSVELVSLDGGAVSVTSGPNTIQAHGSGAQTFRLPDGRVAISGGCTPTTGPISMYDPTANVMDAGTPMASRRCSSSHTLLPSGRAFLAGGLSAALVELTTTESIDFMPYTSGAAAPFGATLTAARVARLPSGEAIVVGASGSSLLWWRLGPSLSMLGAGTLPINGTLHGMVVLSDGRPFVYASRAAAILDVDLTRWSPVASAPSPAPENTAQVTRTIAGDPLVLTTDSAGLLVALMFDVTSQTWRRLAPQPVVGEIVAAVRNGKGTFWVSLPDGSIGELDPVNETWVLATAATGLQAPALLRTDGRMMSMRADTNISIDFRRPGQAGVTSVTTVPPLSQPRALTMPSDDVLWFDASGSTTVHLQSWPQPAPRVLTLPNPALAATLFNEETALLIGTQQAWTYSRAWAVRQEDRPVLNGSTLLGPTTLRINGSGLRGIGSATSDRVEASPADLPYIMVFDADGVVVPQLMSEWSNSAAILEFEGPLPSGSLLVTSMVAGVASRPLRVEIGAPAGSMCTSGVECATRSCLCGVCQFVGVSCDAGVDAGSADAGTPDAGIDAGTPDQGNVDGGVPVKELHLKVGCGCSQDVSLCLVCLALFRAPRRMRRCPGQ